MVNQLSRNFPRVPYPSRRTQTRSGPPRPVLDPPKLTLTVPNLPDGPPTRSGPPRGSPDPSRTSLTCYELPLVSPDPSCTSPRV